jgi:2-haloacid dehalogenase
MKVEAVIFDIGNVLIEWNPERFYDAEIGQAAREKLFAEVDLHGMNDAVDIGEDFHGMVTGTAARHPDHAAHVMLWHDRWIEMASPEIPHSVRLLRALRAKGVPVFALSNFGIGSFEVARGHYPFLDEFDQRFISGHLRQMKPDPAIYETLERDTGIAPGGLLFADDRADNIAAARARGWQAHLFEGPEGWARCLVDAGLLSEAEAA